VWDNKGKIIKKKKKKKRSERSQAAVDVATSVDVSTEFQRLRAAVQSIKLPSELYLTESKQGIRKEDLQTVNIVVENKFICIIYFVS
jgi:hypothetical protein